MTRGLDVGSTVEGLFPYDGPHTPDSVVNAADMLAELVRYLNNATGPGNGTTTLRNAPTICELTQSLRTSLARMDQLIDQLTDGLDEKVHDPTLRYDRGGDAAGAVADAAGLALRDAAAKLPGVCASLENAVELTSHLGHDDSQEVES